MSDQFGGTQIPIQLPAAGEATGDKSLMVILGFCRDVLTAHATAAWQSLHPSLPVVHGIFPHNPERYFFSEHALPALYLYRDKGRSEDAADDYLIDEGPMTLLWVFPPASQNKPRQREAIANGLMKVLEARIRAGRDPAWAIASDADTTAATIAALPTALKTAVATSVAPVTYSGAALNGSVGGAVFAPARPVRVTAANATAGTLATFTGLNVLGSVHTAALVLPANGTVSSTVNFTRVTSIAVQGQADALGTLSFGLGPYTGKGSVLIRHAGMMRLRLTEWKERSLTIRVKDGEPPVAYAAIEATITFKEHLLEDLAAHYDTHDGAGIDIALEDGSVFEQASLPDDGMT